MGKREEGTFLTVVGGLSVYERPVDKVIRIIFNKFRDNRRTESIFCILDIRDLRELVGWLDYVLEEWGMEVVPEERGYTEDITYMDEGVERSLFISKGRAGIVRLSLNVYTDEEYDDCWLDLTPCRVGRLSGLLHGYLVEYGEG